MLSLDIRRLFPGKALKAGNQWYFFSHATQSRTSRNGHWNPVGADELVSSGGSNVGLKKTFIFSIGEEPFQATKTNWVMNEYHLLDGNGSSSSSGSSRKRSHKKKGHSDKVSCCINVIDLAFF
jgi:hypothetical protein